MQHAAPHKARLSADMVQRILDENQQLILAVIGPATNIATMGLVKRELGNRALAAYLGSVVGVGFAFGYLTNYLADQWNIDFLAQTQTAHAMGNTLLATASALVLAGLIIYALGSKHLTNFKTNTPATHG